VIRWDAPGPYGVGFSTRLGGVSEGPYASLNLGIFTGDEPGSVVENRRRLCAGEGVDPERATMAWQQHGGEVRRARPESIVDPGLRHDPCDGLWSDEPGQAMLLLTADCLPIALARLDGPRPALAVLHAGWRGLLAGIVPAGVAALGSRLVTAVIGPAIGPCCYEVGEDVAAPMRAAFGAGLLRDGRLDLWSAAERALRAAGVVRVDRLDLCTACDEARFFSHRRDGGVSGRQGVLARVA
jgi:polyphenol oxidase